MGILVEWIPKCLNVEARSIDDVEEEITKLFGDRLVTMEYTWIHYYDPGTKEQPKDGSSRPKHFCDEKSACKINTSVFWNKDVAIVIDYLEQGSITGVYYTTLLTKLFKKIVKIPPRKICQMFFPRPLSCSQIDDYTAKID